MATYLPTNKELRGVLKEYQTNIDENYLITFQNKTGQIQTAQIISPELTAISQAVQELHQEENCRIFEAYDRSKDETFIIKLSIKEFYWMAFRTSAGVNPCLGEILTRFEEALNPSNRVSKIELKGLYILLCHIEARRNLSSSVNLYSEAIKASLTETDVQEIKNIEIEMKLIIMKSEVMIDQLMDRKHDLLGSKTEIEIEIRNCLRKARLLMTKLNLNYHHNKNAGKVELIIQIINLGIEIFNCKMDNMNSKLKVFDSLKQHMTAPKISSIEKEPTDMQKLEDKVKNLTTTVEMMKETMKDLSNRHNEFTGKETLCSTETLEEKRDENPSNLPQLLSQKKTNKTNKTENFVAEWIDIKECPICSHLANFNLVPQHNHHIKLKKNLKIIMESCPFIIELGPKERKQYLTKFNFCAECMHSPISSTHEEECNLTKKYKNFKCNVKSCFNRGSTCELHVKENLSKNQQRAKNFQKILSHT